MTGDQLVAPFPYFGGKRKAAPMIWPLRGDTPASSAPSAGSLAVLLPRAPPPRTETVNALDGLLVPFWRATAAEPDAVAAAADWPVTELDLTARHAALVRARSDLTARLEADPHYYDATLAGWWVWGACAWLGSGWCSGEGPWSVVDGVLVKADRDGVKRKPPNLRDAGTGINRQLPHLGNDGRGINRQLPHLGEAGKGVNGQHAAIREWMHALSDRLRRVRITTGDWQRVLTPSVTTKHGLTAILLDPPYDHEAIQDARMYGGGTYDKSISAAVRQWCIQNGADPLLRIALCGYGTEHDELLAHGWTRESWRARKGYQSVSSDGTHTGHLEAIWYSPNCINPDAQPGLFDN